MLFRSIREIAKLVEPIEGLFVTPHRPGSGTGYKLEAPAEEAPAREKKEDKTNGTDKTDGTDKEHHSEKCSCGIDHDAAPAQPSSADAVANDVYDAILAGKGDKAADATKRAIAAGAQPQDIINGQMIRAMSQVGQNFQDGKAFVPQLLMAGRAMKAALEILKPLLAGQASTTLGRVVIGTVKGDLHDIGKNLVKLMLESKNIEVIDLGVDVAPERFVQAVVEDGCDICCCSSLLTTTMPMMAEVVKAMEAAGVRDRVKKSGRAHV